MTSMQLSEVALRDSPGALGIYNEKRPSPQASFSNSSPNSDRFIVPGHDDLLARAVTPAYRFSSGIESQDTIDSSFCLTPDLELDEDGISTSTPGSEFHRGLSSSPMVKHDFHRASKLAKVPHLDQYPAVPSTQSTPALRSDTSHDGTSTPGLNLPATTFLECTAEHSSFYSEFAIESEHEMAYLLRHFTEVIAPW
jgi:hypothetical protein